MATKRNTLSFVQKKRVKRKGVHSKNSSKGQNGYKKKTIGQGSQRINEAVNWLSYIACEHTDLQSKMIKKRASVKKTSVARDYEIIFFSSLANQRTQTEWCAYTIKGGKLLKSS